MTMKSLAVMASVVALCTITYLAAEGAYSILLWKDTNGSLVYKVYNRFAGSSASFAKEKQQDDVPGFLRLASRAQIEALLPELTKAGIGVGGTPRGGPYALAKPQGVSITDRSEEGCMIVKPNIHKTKMQLRSNEYRPFRPPTLFFNDDAQLSDELKTFIANYGLRPFPLHTNELGERKTLPQVESTRKILVAGDSVAFGTGIGDEDTIASQLQRRDLTRQYITIAIPGADASDVVCALEKASKRYHGQIDGLVYVYSHTDFDETAKYGQPDQFLEWVKGFAARENIGEVTIVLSANIYNIVPHLTRPVVGKDDDNNDWHKEARAMREGAEAAGFRFVSIAELALEEADRRKTDFGAFALFQDGGGHLSPYGTMRLVETIRSAPARSN